MVHQKARESQTIRQRSHTKKIFGRMGMLFAVLLLAAGAAFAVMQIRENNNELTNNTDGSAYQDSAIAEVEDEKQESVEPELEKYQKINFQPVVDKWAGEITGNKSVLVYDLDRDEIAAQYNIAEYYGTASLYKLFVVYEGYRRVASREWDGEAAAGSTGYTINKCLDLAIRESYSPCAETLWGMIGHETLDGIIENDFGIMNSDISHLVSNVSDIAAIMRRFYEHPDFDDTEMLGAMWDSFLVQPVTTYNWRQGLPSGFTDAKVYNKVGWEYNPGKGYWNIYHDAAIVEFPEDNRHFIVVVMTNQVPYQKIAELGTAIEEYYYNNN